MIHPMKPQTIARRAAERKAMQLRQHKSLLERLAAKVQEHGPDSIYAEMVAELLRRDELQGLAGEFYEEWPPYGME